MIEEKKITAWDVLALLRDRYSKNREWAIASEVQRTTGWSDRRYDFVAMNCYPSSGYKIEVVEIKVSKSDLKHELEEPEKHNVMFGQIDYYSLAAPAEIIDMKIIPPKWGVYAVVNGRLITKRKPIALNDERVTTIDRSFAASFLRAAIEQNMEKAMMSESLKKSYDEGFEAGKKSTYFDEQKQRSYERYRKEANYYRDILWKLGFPMYEYSRALEYNREIPGFVNEVTKGEEKINERFEYLKKSSEVLHAIDMKEMEFNLNGLERSVKELREAVVKVRELTSEKADTPLKPERESDILTLE